MISVQCPACFKSYSVNPKFLGKRVKCKSCSATMLVEDPESAALRSVVTSSSAQRKGRVPQRTSWIHKLPHITLPDRKKMIPIAVVMLILTLPLLPEILNRILAPHWIALRANSDAFKDQIPVWLAISKKSDGLASGINRKVVVVDARTKSLSNESRFVPRHLLASRPEEVELVIIYERVDETNYNAETIYRRAVHLESGEGRIFHKYRIVDPKLNVELNMANYGNHEPGHLFCYLFDSGG